MKEKSRTTAAVLAICLGGYSAHYFYLGNNQAKKRLILALCTLGVMAMVYAVMGIIDGIKFLQMKDETFAEYCAAIPEKNALADAERERKRMVKGAMRNGNMNQVIASVRRSSASVCQILFYIAAGLCFFYSVGNINGGFMPVLGALITMAIQVAIWLLIPVLLSIRRRNIAKWAFLGLSIYWALTTVFGLLQGAGAATEHAPALTAARGVFSFIIACALIVAAVFAVVSYWKRDIKMKRIALAIYLSTLPLFLVFFALCTAWSAIGGSNWNVYFNYVYSYLVIPFAMLFAALAFWLSEADLHFSCLDHDYDAGEKEPKYPAEKGEDSVEAKKAPARKGSKAKASKAAADATVPEVSETEEVAEPEQASDPAAEEEESASVLSDEEERE